jgi:hypothetical protein
MFKDLLMQGAELAKHLKPAQIEKLFDPSIHFREVNNTFRMVGLR